MRKELEARELFGENFTVEPLYDAYGEASFLLGTTELGYAIIYREDGTVYECGEASPFTNFDSCKKYYAGALSYYVQRADNTEFRNLMTGSYEALPIPFIIESTPERAVVVDPSPSVNSVKLSNAHYITRYAFGWNDSGECVAIACAIALNYVKRQYNLPVVADNCTHELMNKPYPEDSSDNEFMYPNAERCWRKLTHFNICGYSRRERLTGELNHYLEATISNPSKRPIVYGGGKMSYTNIRKQLLLNRPVLIEVRGHADYGNHDLVAYGCRTVGSTNELLVHAGWHSTQYFNRVGYCWELKNIWLNRNTIDYAHYIVAPG